MWLQPRDYVQVGEVLAAAREEVGLTQIEIAARLGKPQSFVSSYERGQRRVDLLEFLAIARALNADPEKLFRKVMKIERLASNPKRRSRR